jgi:N-acetylmuramic acid 6-phosphate etherase
MVNLDQLPTAEVVRLLLDAERRVVPAAEQVQERIAAAAELLAERLRAGGRVAFAGAGTSGRIAAAEAAELPGTFGLDRRTVLSSVAGATDAAEDDLDVVQRDVTAFALTERDVLVAVAASGATPYTLELARSVPAAVIAVVTVPDSPLAKIADVAIEVVVGEEVLRESTRLTAGTAQKVALNALTTAAMARVGRVHGDLMIDVEPANAKLRDRATGIVAEIAGCSPDAAAAALDACGSARAAVLHVVLGLDPEAAEDRARQFSSLRDALNP